MFALHTAVAAGTSTPPRNSFSPAEDIELGRDAAGDIRARLPLLQDPALDALVDDVGRRLVEGLPSALRHQGFEYSFDVLGRMMIDSAALPGGPVFISRGLVQAAATEGELAGVLAHEIGHVALRHATAQATSGERFQMGAISGRDIGAAVAGTRDSILSQGRAFAVASYFLTYGAALERQADALAARLMAHAGYDPADIGNGFRSIAAEGAGRGGPQWVSRHPGSGGESFDPEDMPGAAGAVPYGRAISPQADRLAPIRARVREMRPHMEPQPTGNTAAGAVGHFSVAVPSGESRIVTAGDSLVISVPANWQRLPAGNTVAFAPDGAFLGTLRGPIGVTHGVQVGVARSVTDDVRSDTQALMQMLALAGRHVRWTPAYQRTTIAGRAGLTSALHNVSPVTGRFEQVFVATAPLPDGHLLYLLGVAPIEESGTYRKAFDRIRESVLIVN